MRRALRILVQLASCLGPYAMARYHATYVRKLPFSTVAYSPWWLVAYGFMFMLSAFLFGVPGLIEHPKRALLAPLLAASSPLALASIAFVVYDPNIPRLVVVGTAAVMLAIYIVASALHGALWLHSDRSERVVFVVESEQHARLHVDLARQPERKFSVVAVMALEELAADPATLDAVVAGNAATMIVLSEGAELSDEVVSQASALHERGIRVRSLVAFYDDWLGKFPLDSLERTSLWFDIREVHEVHYTRMKRTMDIASALLLLPPFVIAVPVVWAGNRFGNRGPLFFGQFRVGLNDEQFRMWKFRTMTVSSVPDGAGEWTTTSDPRITPFGGLLRRSHLDELPQVLNVFAGDLSIVGPRPEQPRYVRDLQQKIPFYHLRHLVKPGITGWAQVKYPYGASEEDALEKLQYELYYLKHQSPSLDVRVCFRTMRSMMFGEGR